MSLSTTQVLVAGATGRLGGLIVQSLAVRPDTHVRVMVRNAALEEAEKARSLAQLRSAGAEVVVADLADPASLERATRGIDVIVSAVQGGPETILDGQAALLAAAKRNGVRRFMPSAFALDYYKLPKGWVPGLDLRRAFDERLASEPIEHMSVLVGAFTEVALAPFFGLIDMPQRQAHLWGDGNAAFDMTTMPDAARFTAAIALDRSIPNGPVSFAGDTLSLNQLISAVESAAGSRVERIVRGDLDALEARVTSLPAEASWFDGYHLAMLSGRGRLTHLANARYPDIKPATVAAFLTSHMHAERAA